MHLPTGNWRRISRRNTTRLGLRTESAPGYYNFFRQVVFSGNVQEVAKKVKSGGASKVSVEELKGAVERIGQYLTAIDEVAVEITGPAGPYRSAFNYVKEKARDSKGMPFSAAFAWILAADGDRITRSADPIGEIDLLVDAYQEALGGSFEKELGKRLLKREPALKKAVAGYLGGKPTEERIISELGYRALYQLGKLVAVDGAEVDFRAAERAIRAKVDRANRVAIGPRQDSYLFQERNYAQVK